MTSLQITQGFKEDLLAVESDRVLEHILDVVGLLQTIPTMGSRELPDSIRIDFGDGVRKIPVDVFDLIVTYDEKNDVVTIAGIVHQRTAW